jgi:hypothetical protein
MNMSELNDEFPVEEKKSPARPKAQPKETMTKELMLKKVNAELALLKEQADTLQEVVKQLEASQRGADASTTTVEKIDDILEEVSNIRPSLIRLRGTLKARIIERLK